VDRLQRAICGVAMGAGTAALVRRACNSGRQQNSEVWATVAGAGIGALTAALVAGPRPTDGLRKDAWPPPSKQVHTSRRRYYATLTPLSTRCDPFGTYDQAVDPGQVSITYRRLNPTEPTEAVLCIPQETTNVTLDLTNASHTFASQELQKVGFELRPIPNNGSVYGDAYIYHEDPRVTRWNWPQVAELIFATTSAPDPGAALQRIDIVFETTKDDKDHDTGLEVELLARDGRLLALFSHGHAPPLLYNDPSSHSESLQIQGVVHQLDALQARVRITIDPVGHDTWKFDWYLRYQWAGHTTQLTSKTFGVTLYQDEKSKTWEVNIQPNG
jgi:hypothetical protein